MLPSIVRIDRGNSMTADSARKWLILSSLLITGAQGVFLMISPAIIPIETTKSTALLQIVMPVFVGYLGSAAHFIFMAPPPPAVPVNNQFLGYLVWGPLAIYVAFVVTAFVAFTILNRPGAIIGAGMSVDTLSTALTWALSLLAATTGVVVSYLFVAQKAPVAEPTKPV